MIPGPPDVKPPEADYTVVYVPGKGWFFANEDELVLVGGPDQGLPPTEATPKK